MLESLSIRNYAIIDEMRAEFSGGLNVITGETGAGKSIVVDALELVLGARASSEMIRTGAPALEVSGVFSLEKSLLKDVLPFDIEEDTLILRREVRADGNSRCYVNDRPVTLKVLKEIGNRLVDFHGQHDHQSLLAVSEHVRFLDGYGGLEALAERVRALYADMVRVRRSIAGLKEAIETARRDRELYSFQAEEIERAGLSPGEDEELENEIRKLAKAVELKALGFRLFQRLSEDELSVARQLGEMAGEIERLAGFDGSIAEYSETLARMVEDVEDVARFFRGYADEMDDDPALLAELEERLALVERLKKKYGPTLGDVFSYHEEVRKRLEEAEHSEDELAGLESDLERIRSRLAESARELSAGRKEAAPRLSREVESHLSELGMSGARLVVHIGSCDSAETVGIGGKPVPVTENGLDRVEFLLSANPGEPPKPLVRVASGGEISRVMLALKLVLMDVNRVPSMVFDEIDVGVSGRIAEALGRKLLKLTEKRQALVITHLPQIAAMARKHFSARKKVVGGRTAAGLVVLDDEMRRRELASLLSGETLSETALAHARELMEEAGRRKKRTGEAGGSAAD